MLQLHCFADLYLSFYRNKYHTVVLAHCVFDVTFLVLVVKLYHHEGCRQMVTIAGA